MIVGMTLGQMKKVQQLSPRDFEKLKWLITHGGATNYAEDLEHLKEVGLIKKVGGACFVSFLLNGISPIRSSGVRRKGGGGSEIFAYKRIWEKYTHTEATPMVMGLLKKFMSNYSVIEFKSIVKEARSCGVVKNSEDVTKVWSLRAKFGAVTEEGNAYEEFDQLTRGK